MLLSVTAAAVRVRTKAPMRPQQQQQQQQQQQMNGRQPRLGSCSSTRQMAATAAARLEQTKHLAR
jgi:hypothetical protein